MSKDDPDDFFNTFKAKPTTKKFVFKKTGLGQSATSSSSVPTINESQDAPRNTTNTDNSSQSQNTQVSSKYFGKDKSQSPKINKKNEKSKPFVFKKTSINSSQFSACTQKSSKEKEPESSAAPTKKKSLKDFFTKKSVSTSSIKKSETSCSNTQIEKKIIRDKTNDVKCTEKPLTPNSLISISSEEDFDLTLTQSLKTNKSPPKKTSLESSPISLKTPEKSTPKKFVFKKKVVCSKPNPNISESDISTTSSPVLNKITESISQHSVKSLPSTPTFNLNDSVTQISPSLLTTEDDFMDDDQFERLFGSSTNTKRTKLENDYLADDINIEDIDWDSEVPTIKTKTDLNSSNLLSDININEVIDEQFDEDTPLFSTRIDSSKEFQKSYPHSTVMKEVLTERFGLRTFRPHQMEICNASLTGHDIFVLMPTGGGKSLCYQLPATLSVGVTIVISPLRSLISDQVDKMNALDIPAAHLCSDISESESTLIWSKLSKREPDIKLLFLTPEKINASNKCIQMLNGLYERDKLARFVIDEAHCLSQWGHDFRPDYKQLSCLRVRYPKVPIICLTATATRQVEGDVISILQLRNVKTFIRSFNRPNIKYITIHKTKANVVDQIANLIKQKFLKKSGIVYCLSRDNCDSMAKELSKFGIKAASYHAGLSAKIRDQKQRAWMQDQFHVIVGTIAFGLGIDKPDVRFVIHNTVPKSIEAFYQESGRAGRDGELSFSYLFYSYSDVKRLQRLMMLERSNQKALQGHFENLKQMVSYCENMVDCRRYLMLIHLGENFDRKICIKNKQTTCDNCERHQNYKPIDVTRYAKELCKIIQDFCRQKVTLSQVSDIYKGSKAKKIMERQYNKHTYYGNGSSYNRNDIQRILKQLLVKDILMERCEYMGEFPQTYIHPGKKIHEMNNSNFSLLISMSSKENTELDSLPTISKSTVNAVLNNQPTNKSNYTISSNTVKNPTPSTSKDLKSLKQEIGKLQVSCHEDLLEECRKLAVERNVTLSAIMNLSAIKTMSDVLPKTKEEFVKIQHVTTANYEKYGEFFLKITSKYRDMVDKLKSQDDKSSTPTSKFKVTSADDNDEDWWYDSSQSSTASSSGVKRKYSGGFKKGTKKFKRGGRKGKGRKSPKKKKPGKGNLALMPVHVK